MKLNIINDSGMDLSEDTLNKWIKGIATELKKKKIIDTDKKTQEVSLVFLNENDAKKLNWNYRCKDYPTDILSFGSDDPTSMGELVLCPQVISRQAKEHGLSLEDELGYIMLHGVLHLLGFDHEKSKVDEERMMSIQDEVFDNLRNPKSAKKGKTEVEAPKKNLTVKKAATAKSAKPAAKAAAKVAVKAAVKPVAKSAAKPAAKSAVKAAPKTEPAKKKKKK
ncbi:MAG: rRNA maturation RNase YbeY [Bdellovibrio sp. 28-41-41]|nr:MAG: rRNA maturation RNase YbeY [Bdellovibrio sp. 28-41-41]